jgi:activator of HSP90 ATPase
MQFTVQKTINAPAKIIYSAWLNSVEHSKMTGGKAKTTDKLNSKFTAWDGYITGKNVELIPNSYIKQVWRTSEFAKNQPDSILELKFIKISSKKTKVILKHSKLEDIDIHYKKGWGTHYFTPMKEYFESK